MVTPADFLRATTSGTRVVVRHLIDDGRATDSLGYFHLADDTHCVVATARGLETIELARVIAAKEVPPPPAPRPRATSSD
ncbi:MAG: hypothetical protein ACKVI4_01685 [Actinomycetales bacterium]|uniref:hypothetical protein n=1 Tax=uncultured Salinibacterium sp. TaxID=459274 RepID=UPI0030DBFE3C|tara:strand:- start:209 stop:448 length:240 start_codon:yes stop_codon:yes gene_type:complete